MAEKGWSFVDGRLMETSLRTEEILQRCNASPFFSGFLWIGAAGKATFVDGKPRPVALPVDEQGGTP